MDYGFTEYQTAIRDLAREIAEKEIRPIAAEYDREAKFPWPVVKVMAETDLFRVYIEDEYGGISDGSPIMNMVIVTEELSKACGGIALSFAGTALGTLPIILSGSEEQKKRWLPDIAAGRKLAAFALTEPQAGSDAGGGAHHGHSRRRLLRDERHQAVDHQRWRGGNLLGHCLDEPLQRAARGFLHRRGERHAGVHFRQEGRQAGHSRFRHARVDFPPNQQNERRYHGFNKGHSAFPTQSGFRHMLHRLWCADLISSFRYSSLVREGVIFVATTLGQSRRFPCIRRPGFDR